MKKITRMITVFLSTILMLVGSVGNAAEMLANTTATEQTSMSPTPRNSIAYLVGSSTVNKPTPLSGEVFTMELQLNSQSKGSDEIESIRNYTVEFDIPTTVGVSSFPKSNSLYTVSPEKPQSGDHVTITFIQGVPVAMLNKLSFDFYFHAGTSVPSDVFAPTISLSATNADATTITQVAVTPRNNNAPVIMDVTTDGTPAHFAHASTITLTPENYLGGLNHDNSTVTVVFPVDAEVHSVTYNGTDYPVTTLPSGEQQAVIPVADFNVGENTREIILVYSYPYNMTPDDVAYEIDITYSATRKNGDAVIENKQLAEIVPGYVSGDGSASLVKNATHDIYRRAYQTVTYEMTFLPIADFKNATIIDDPVRGGETDYFEVLNYDSIIWNFAQTTGRTGNISTEILYETSATPGTWQTATAGVNGTLQIADLGLATGVEVTRLQFKFTYNGSNEIPAGVGSVKIRLFAQTGTAISDTSKSFDDGITNFAYITGELKAPGTTTYEAIEDNGVDNKKEATTGFKTAGPYIGYAGWEQPFSTTTAKIGESFTYQIRTYNLGGDVMLDPITYIEIDDNVKIENVSVGAENAEISIIKASNRQVIKVRYNEDFPVTGWGSAFSTIVVTASGITGSSAQFDMWSSSGNETQPWEFNTNEIGYIGGVGHVRIAMSARWKTINFQTELGLAPTKTSSADGTNFDHVANAIIPGDETGYYAISVQNKSDYDLTEVRIIDMLPTINDTMTINADSKRSTITPTVKSLTMKDGSAIPADASFYYSEDATYQSNYDELSDFTNVTATWTLWNGTTTLPTTAKAIKIVKANGLLLDEALEFVLEVEFPSTITGVQKAWNSMSASGKFNDGTVKYLLPGEPEKTGIFVSENAANQTLAGTIFEDQNGNDVKDDAERRIADITVNLYDDQNSLIDTTTTDSNGYYEFTNLYEALYRVEFDLPYTYMLSEFKTGTDTTIDIDFADMVGDNAVATAYINLATEASPLAVDAGIHRKITIGDYAWHDLNQDGLQNVAEPGLHNVQLELIKVTTTRAEEVVATTMSSSTGQYLFTNQSPGTYYIRATLPSHLDSHVATQYLVNGETESQNSKFNASLVTDTFLITSGETAYDVDLGVHELADTLGTITLTKVDEMGVALAGATFGIWASDADTDVDLPIATTTSDAAGLVTFANLPLATYIVKETIAPSGYDLNSATYSATLSETTTNVDLGTITNTLTKGAVTLTKVDETGVGLAGATFGIWVSGADVDVDLPIDTATSNSTGAVSFDNLLPNTYIVKETIAPTGYILDTTEHTATITLSTLTIDLGTITNVLMTGAATLTKVDEAGNVLAGATFGIWASGANTNTDTPITTAVSDSAGLVTFNNLVPNNYIIKEVLAPSGYDLDTTEYPVAITLTTLVVDLGTIANTLTKGSITLTKVDESGTALIGASFGLWQAGADTTVDAPTAQLTSDAAGQLTFTNVLPGNYIIKETLAPTGYDLDNTEYPVTITLTALSVDLGSIINTLTRGSITLTKVDEASNALAGATFGLWEASKNPSLDAPITTETSDSLGNVYFTNLLPNTYIVKEVSAPSGYELDTTEHGVVVSLTDLDQHLGTITNTLTTGAISLTKVDEVGNGLAGATFGIWAGDANTTIDAPLATSISDGTGRITFGSLLPGDYIIKETIAPIGYELAETEYPATITLASTTVDLGTITNILLKGDITLTKVDESGAGLAGATFGIWLDGANINTDAPIATVISDSLGYVNFTNLLPATYIVKEIIAPTGYILDHTEHEATITLTALTIDLGTISNTLLRGTATLTKIDEMGVALADATFAIWPATADMTVDAPLATATSDATGIIVFANLLPGSYIVQETVAPHGYDLDTTPHDVTITLTNLQIDLGNIMNIKTTGTITLTKVDEAGSTLANATFGLWSATADIATTEPLMTETSNETGTLTFTNVAMGTYIIKETAAPDGYNLADTTYEVTLDLDNLIVDLGNIINTKTEDELIATGENDIFYATMMMSSSMMLAVIMWIVKKRRAKQLLKGYTD